MAGAARAGSSLGRGHIGGVASLVGGPVVHIRDIFFE